MIRQSWSDCQSSSHIHRCLPFCDGERLYFDLQASTGCHTGGTYRDRIAIGIQSGKGNLMLTCSSSALKLIEGYPHATVTC